jgi:hypothetical protein
MEPNWESASWRKSVFSDTGACVEVAHSKGWVGVRDTKARGAGPVLAFTEREWRAFVRGASEGEFDYDLLSKAE